jgi:acetamidase/formamidase
MTIHTLVASEETLRGYFSHELPPVLTIDPGDTVRLNTLDAGWGLEPPHLDGTPRRKLPQPAGTLRGHALCGPIAVRGAEPGMTLAVRIDTLRTGSWGWTWSGGWSSKIHDYLGTHEGGEVLLRWDLDPDEGIAVNQYGHRVRMRPFLGVIGLAPPEAGQHLTTPPRPWGGNIDCKELIADSTLYLPIAVSGGLLSVGDGHAAQGDGEVAGPAIECPMDVVELTINLYDDMPLTAPQARTPAGWVTLGFDEDLHQAALKALEAMVEHLQQRLGVERKVALGLASVAVDLRITQLVNGVVGVHALLPVGAIL